MIEAASVGGLFRISATSLDRLAQPLHGEFDVLRLQMAPALDFGLIAVFREAFEIVRSILPCGVALFGELFADKRVKTARAVVRGPDSMGRHGVGLKD